MKLFSELSSEQQQEVCGGGAAGDGKPGPQSGIIYDSGSGLTWDEKDPGGIAISQSKGQASLVVTIQTINNGSGIGGLNNAFGT